MIHSCAKWRCSVTGLCDGIRRVALSSSRLSCVSPDRDHGYDGGSCSDRTRLPSLLMAILKFFSTASQTCYSHSPHHHLSAQQEHSVYPKASSSSPIHLPRCCFPSRRYRVGQALLAVGRVRLDHAFCSSLTWMPLSPLSNPSHEAWQPRNQTRGPEHSPRL